MVAAPQADVGASVERARAGIGQPRPVPVGVVVPAMDVDSKFGRRRGRIGGRTAKLSERVQNLHGLALSDFRCALRTRQLLGALERGQRFGD